MKNTILSLALIVTTLFLSCAEDEKEDLPKGIKMQFNAYTKYDPRSIPVDASAKFFLFDANNGEKFTEERINIPNEDPYGFDYDDANCKMIILLRSNEFELSDGTRVKPAPIDKRYSIYVSSSRGKSIYIPKGRYYVVALFVEEYDSDWEYTDKYSGKYIDVNESISDDDKFISINFPCDGKNKGFIDWVTTDW